MTASPLTVQVEWGNIDNCPLLLQQKCRGILVQVFSFTLLHPEMVNYGTVRLWLPKQAHHAAESNSPPQAAASFTSTNSYIEIWPQKK